MTKAGNVVLHRRPQDAPWKFKDAYVKDNGSDQFTVTVPSDGLLRIKDRGLTGAKRPTATRSPWSSSGTTTPRNSRVPDPVIVNDPGAKVAFLAGQSTKK
jgi:hypothetical protein